MTTTKPVTMHEYKDEIPIEQTVIRLDSISRRINFQKAREDLTELTRLAEIEDVQERIAARARYQAWIEKVEEGE